MTDNPQGSVPLSEGELAEIETLAQREVPDLGEFALKPFIMLTKPAYAFWKIHQQTPRLLATIRHQQAQLEQARAERDSLRGWIEQYRQAVNAVLDSWDEGLIVKLRGVAYADVVDDQMDALYEVSVRQQVAHFPAASPSQESAEGVQE